MGFKEILLVAIVILILFGAKRIPALMQGMGKGIRDFSDAKKDTAVKTNEDL
jgi:sec-independent protein translocase protein TatA